jgi:hypothetical protein
MVELIALVVTGYLCVTLGIGALIGKGHGPAPAMADRLSFDTTRSLCRDQQPGRALGVGWDATTWGSMDRDAVGWDLAA